MKKKNNNENKIYKMYVGPYRIFTDYKKFVKVEVDDPIDIIGAIMEYEPMEKIHGLSKCNLDAGDTFDFEVGVQLAFSRLLKKLRKLKINYLKREAKYFDKSIYLDDLNRRFFKKHKIDRIVNDFYNKDIFIGDNSN